MKLDNLQETLIREICNKADETQDLMKHGLLRVIDKVSEKVSEVSGKIVQALGKIESEISYLTRIAEHTESKNNHMKWAL